MNDEQRKSWRNRKSCSTPSKQWQVIIRRLTLFMQLSLIVAIGHTWLQYGTEWHALTHWRLNWFHPAPLSDLPPTPHNGRVSIVATQHRRLQINCEIRGNHARIMVFVLRDRCGNDLTGNRWVHREKSRPIPTRTFVQLRVLLSIVILHKTFRTILNQYNQFKWFFLLINLSWLNKE